jgi:outer membrane lipoprotein-sorting protein
MKEANKREEVIVEKLLDKLDEPAARDPQAQARGRARFLAQAQAFAKSQAASPAVSRKEEVRHKGWNKNFFERILNTMKPVTKYSALAAVAVIAAIIFFVTSNVTPVSAQKIMSKATAARTLPAQGIWYTQIQIYQNHAKLAGDHPGTTTFEDEYFDVTSGQYRIIVQDDSRKLQSIVAFDGTYMYSGQQTGGSDLLQVTRSKADPAQTTKSGSSTDTSTAAAGFADPTAISQELFDEFNNNPRVKVDSKTKQLGDTPVYVLVDDNYQTKQGSDEKTYMGSMRMIFDAKTYQLLESQTTVHEGDQDIVIDEVKWLVNEVLPEGSAVVWDLSDQKGINVVDGEQMQEGASPTIETLTESELAAHTNSFYVLTPLPDGYTEKIIAVAGQPTDQDYQFEINYTGPNGETFGLQAIGKTDKGFIESNFYDGIYQTTSGLVLNYSSSQPNGGTSAILSTPDETSFLLISSLSRDQVQNLVEILVKGQ